MLLLCMKLDMLNFVMKDSHELVSNRRDLKSLNGVAVYKLNWVLNCSTSSGGWPLSCHHGGQVLTPSRTCVICGGQRCSPDGFASSTLTLLRQKNSTSATYVSVIRH